MKLWPSAFLTLTPENSFYSQSYQRSEQSDWNSLPETVYLEQSTCYRRKLCQFTSFKSFSARTDIHTLFITFQVNDLQMMMRLSEPAISYEDE